MKLSYKTKYGQAYNGFIEDFIRLPKFKKYLGKIDLIFTSPPFPLNRKKAYGNLVGEEYLNWVTEIFKGLLPFLSDTGSIVVEIGNSWEKGSPSMSTLPLETLLSIKKECNLSLCQTFIWNNPAKLPSPASWVNVDRTRVKDSFTNIWWYSKTPNPKANNRNVLKEYSKSMQSLLKKQKYNSGRRPSEHVISAKSFLKDHGGAIPGSVISAANTATGSKYMEYCKLNSIKYHPARMPAALPEFFIKLLTDEGDLVLDPFGGSNTTGAVANHLNRDWIYVEPSLTYVQGSEGRFK